jgi:hypothetical protein
LSHTFRPAYVKDEEMRNQFDRLQRALNDAQTAFDLVVLHAAPDRMRAGMLVYADGTDWNPGSGEGVYRRNAANAAWVYLG